MRVAAATDNFASLGVIRRLGFHFEGIAREAERCQGRWLDHAALRPPRDRRDAAAVHDLRGVSSLAPTVGAGTALV